jgi:predicted ArsR family transcriptional regulator
MRRRVESYLHWLAAGNESPYLDAVRVALDERPSTRREIAERAGVSINYAALALDVLVELGEAEQRGTRGRARGRWQPAKLYARTAVGKLGEAA